MSGEGYTLEALRRIAEVARATQNRNPGSDYDASWWEQKVAETEAAARAEEKTAE